MKQVVYCVYDDGHHITCFDAELKAKHYVEECISSSRKYLEYVAEEVEDASDCDCGGPK